MTERLKPHRLLLIAVFATVIGMTLLAVGAWAYDMSQEEQIAPGITVGGVDIGDRSADEAREVIEQRVVAPLRRPVVVTFNDSEFKLSPKQLDQDADVDGMVDEALAESREGGIGARTLRYLRGEQVDFDVEPRVSYDSEAVDEFVARIAAEVNRDPENASITPSGDSLTATSGQNGIALREDRVSELVRMEVESPRGPRTVPAAVRRTKPEITRNELAQQYPTYVTIDRAGFSLRLFKNLKLVKTYTIAVGQAGLETPSGTYTVQDKQVNPTWYVPESDWAGELAGQVIPPGPGNPLEARWIGIYNGAGIHGTSDIGSLGSAASHGCVRMAVPDVIDLYDRVPMGTPIYVS